MAVCFLVAIDARMLVILRERSRKYLLDERGSEGEEILRRSG